MTDSVSINSIDRGVLRDALRDVPAWATEETLGRILAQLKRGGSGGGGPVKSGKSTEDAIDDLADILDQFQKGLSEDRREYTETELKAQKLYDFWSNKNLVAMAAITSAFSVMRQAVITNANSFDLLYRSGVSLGEAYSDSRDSFDSLRRTVIDTGLDLKTFSDIITRFGTSVNAIGATRLARVMPEVSRRLASFGYNLADAAEVIGAYTDIQLSLGNLQSKSNDQISRESIELAENLSMTSMVMGKNRTQLIEQTRALSASVDANVLALRLGETAAKSAAVFAAGFKDQGLGTQFIEMMSSEIPVLNKTFQSLVKSGMGPFGERLMNLSRGLDKSNPVKAAIQFQEFYKKNANYIDSEIVRLKYLAEAGVEGASESLDTLVKMKAQAEAIAKKTPEALKKEAAANEALNGLKNEWTSLMNTFGKVFSPSIGLMQIFTIGLRGVNQGITALIGAFDWATNKFEGAINAVIGPLGFDGITVSAGALATGLVGLAAGVLAVTKGLALFRAMMGIYRNGGKLPGTGGVAGGVGEAAAGAGKGVGKALGGLASGVGSGFQKIMEGLAGGIGAFANPKILVGATILSGTIAILSGGVAAAMYLAGKALPEFTRGLAGLNDIDGGNLGKVGAGLGRVASGMTAFAGAMSAVSLGSLLSSGIDGLTRLFGGTGPLGKIDQFAQAGATMASSASGMLVFNNQLDRLLATDLKRLAEVTEGLGRLAAPVGRLTGVQSASTPGRTSIESAVSVTEDAQVKTKTLNRPDNPAGSPPGVVSGASPDILTVLNNQNLILARTLTATENLLSNSREMLARLKTI